MSYDKSSPRSTVALVNGRPITRFVFETVLADIVEHFQKRGGTVPPEVLGQLKQRVIDQLVERELVFQECDRRTYPIDEADVDAQVHELAEPFGGEPGLCSVLTRKGVSLEEVRGGIRRDLLIDKFLETEVHRDVAIDPGAIRRYYELNRGRFSYKERRQVGHISFPIPNGAPASRLPEARLALAGLRGRIIAGEDFAAVGDDASRSSDAIHSGDLGLVEHGTLISELDEVAFALSVGETSAVVESALGVHLLKLIERQPPRDLEFDEAVPLIEKTLLSEKREELTTAYVSELKQTAVIQILDL